jgi:hypothetical protein
MKRFNDFKTRKLPQNVNTLDKKQNKKNYRLKWKKSETAFKNASYEILRAFNKKFSIRTRNC